jgi:hypothetical protein
MSRRDWDFCGLWARPFFIQHQMLGISVVPGPIQGTEELSQDSRKFILFPMPDWGIILYFASVTACPVAWSWEPCYLCPTPICHLEASEVACSVPHCSHTFPPGLTFILLSPTQPEQGPLQHEALTLPPTFLPLLFPCMLCSIPSRFHSTPRSPCYPPSSSYPCSLCLGLFTSPPV